MNDFGSSAWSAVVTVSTTKKPQTSEDLQKAVTKGDVETVKNILPGEACLEYLNSYYLTPSFKVKIKTPKVWSFLKAAHTIRTLGFS